MSSESTVSQASGSGTDIEPATKQTSDVAPRLPLQKPTVETLETWVRQRAAEIRDELAKTPNEERQANFKRLALKLSPTKVYDVIQIMNSPTPDTELKPKSVSNLFSLVRRKENKERANYLILDEEGGSEDHSEQTEGSGHGEEHSSRLPQTAPCVDANRALAAVSDALQRGVLAASDAFQVLLNQSPPSNLDHSTRQIMTNIMENIARCRQAVHQQMDMYERRNR